MKMRFDLVAAIVIGLAQIVSAATAAETFKLHEANIITSRCVVVDGYVFGVGRAISKNGGNSVGFSKARLLAFDKIVDMARQKVKWPNGSSKEARSNAWSLLMADKNFVLSLERCETVFERCDGPNRYLAIVAVRNDLFESALPDIALLSKYLSLAQAKGNEKTLNSDTGEPILEYEPRGYYEENNIKINETLSEAQFL